MPHEFVTLICFSVGAIVVVGFIWALAYISNKYWF
jgi:hypothetical protein